MSILGAMPTDHDLILAGLILIVGLLYSSVGHAGASGYLAVMALMGVSAAVMKPTALVLNILVATITTVQFWRAGHFDWRLFWPFAVTSIPMAFLGGRITLPPEYYKPLIGVILLLSAVRIVWVSMRRHEELPHPPSKGAALGVGAVLGFTAGLTGTGGGIFLSPLLLLCNWADPKRTSGVSAPFILVNSIAGIAGLLTSKSATLPEALPWWCAAALIGGVIGSYLGARKFDTRMLRRMLALVLVIAGGKLVWEGVVLMMNSPKGTTAVARS